MSLALKRIYKNFAIDNRVSVSGYIPAKVYAVLQWLFQGIPGKEFTKLCLHFLKNSYFS